MHVQVLMHCRVFVLGVAAVSMPIVSMMEVEHAWDLRKSYVNVCVVIRKSPIITTHEACKHENEHDKEEGDRVTNRQTIASHLMLFFASLLLSFA